MVRAASCVDAHEYGDVGVDAFQFADMEEDPRLMIDPGKPKIYCPVHDEAYQLDLIGIEILPKMGWDFELGWLEVREDWQWTLVVVRAAQT